LNPPTARLFRNDTLRRISRDYYYYRKFFDTSSDIPQAIPFLAEHVTCSTFRVLASALLLEPIGAITKVCFGSTLLEDQYPKFATDKHVKKYFVPVFGCHFWLYMIPYYAVILLESAHGAVFARVLCPEKHSVGRRIGDWPLQRVRERFSLQAYAKALPGGIPFFIMLPAFREDFPPIYFATTHYPQEGVRYTSVYFDEEVDVIEIDVSSTEPNAPLRRLGVCVLRPNPKAFLTLANTVDILSDRPIYRARNRHTYQWRVYTGGIDYELYQLAQSGESGYRYWCTDRVVHRRLEHTFWDYYQSQAWVLPELPQLEGLSRPRTV